MTCVEPSSLLPMNNPAITSLRMDCRQMLEMDGFKYDVLLIVQVMPDCKSVTILCGNMFLEQAIHNISVGDDLTDIFRGVLRQLKEGGRICIVTRPDCSRHLPFFEVGSEVSLAFFLGNSFILGSARALLQRSDFGDY